MESEAGVRGRGFASQAVTMAFGSALAQGLVLLVMPLLTRLYGPTAIGAQALFVSMSASLVVLATLRLDLALVLPDSHDDALRIGALVFYQSLALGGIVAVGISLVHTFPEASIGWVWLLVPMLVFGAMLRTGIGLATRNGRFAGVATANVAGSLLFAAIALALGLLGAPDSGVVWARLAAPVAGVAVLVALGVAAVKPLTRWNGLRLARRDWREQRQFIAFNTPYSLVGGVARDTPLYLFALAAAPGVVAAYALARAVTLAPTTLVSSAISSVFFREAARGFGTNALELLAQRLTRIGLFASAPAFGALAVWGDQIFGLVFGEEWEAAGRFSQALAIPLWLALQAGWPERLFEVARRQRLSFVLQLTFDVINGGLVVLTFVVTRDALTAVVVYSFGYAVQQAAYVTAVYRVGGFDMRRFGATASLAIGALSMWSALFAVIRCWDPGLPGLGLTVAIALVATAVTISRFARSRGEAG